AAAGRSGARRPPSRGRRQPGGSARRLARTWRGSAAPARCAPRGLAARRIAHGRPHPALRPPAGCKAARMNDDIDRVMAVMEAAFDPAYGEAWTRRQIEDALTFPGTHLLLADAGGAMPAEGAAAAGF